MKKSHLIFMSTLIFFSLGSNLQAKEIGIGKRCLNYLQASGYSCLGTIAGLGGAFSPGPEVRNDMEYYFNKADKLFQERSFAQKTEIQDELILLDSFNFQNLDDIQGDEFRDFIRELSEETHSPISEIPFLLILPAILK